MKTSIPSPDTKAPSTPWITAREAAAYIGVHTETILDACNAGKLRHSRLGRRSIRLKREWVDAWLHEYVAAVK